MTSLTESMLPDLWEALNTLNYDDDVDFVWVESIEPQGATASVTFELRPYNTDLVVAQPRWRVIATGVVRVTADTLGGPSPDLSITDDDVALWSFVDKHEALFFTGSASDPEKLAGALHEAHRSVVAGRVDELPFSLHLPADKLFAGGGLLFNGPSRLVDAYARVLEAHGLKASRLPKTDGYAYWDPVADDYVTAADRLLVGRFGVVQIIAESFSAIPLGARTEQV